MGRRRNVVLILFATLALLMTQTASAVMFRNTINPDVTMNQNGRHLLVRGPIACDEGELLRVRITVTQATTGALAQGYTSMQCEGEDMDMEWMARAVTYGAARFEPGEAQACAMGLTRLHGQVTDIRQWCAANNVQIRYE